MSITDRSQIKIADDAVEAYFSHEAERMVRLPPGVSLIEPHDPAGLQRPTVVWYLDVHPNTATGRKPEQIHHRLGPPSRPADELMHRHFLAAMGQLAASARFVAGKAFYPDESGLLVACMLWRPDAAMIADHAHLDGNRERMARNLAAAPRRVWVGYNARSTYAAAMVGIHGLPAELVGDHGGLSAGEVIALQQAVRKPRGPQ